MSANRTGSSSGDGAGGATPSFWLDEVGARPTRPRLDERRDADVCIVGGGFTGLWTAYELRRADPSLEVVVLEAEHVGFGASGRNGGWVLGKVSGSVSAWEQRGPGAAAAMARAINATVAEIGAAVAREGIECDWQQGGSLTVAQSPSQLDRVRAEFATERRLLGDESPFEWLEGAALADRVRVDGALGAMWTPHCARVQPARLVVGLAAAAERAGAVVYERSRVSQLRPGCVCVEGAPGAPAIEVRARHVLLATEGYTANLPGRRRVLLPLNSAMIVTEPLPASTWESIGWAGAETILDGSHAYTYSQRTRDGRIAIGGRGVPYRFGSRTDREGPVPAQTIAELRERLSSLFPQTADVGVERAWHGVLGVSRDWCPRVGFDHAGGFGFAGGYAGEGVAASNLAARTLRDLVLGRDSELTRLPWVGSGARGWEPEPLRWMGARGIYGMYRYADRQEASTGRGSWVAGAADRIAGR